MGKKTAIIVLLVTVAVWLVGCGSSGSTVVPAAGSGSALPQEHENALPTVSQLVVGTLALDDTPMAVDAAQAGELRTLWRAYQSVGESDSASSVEMDALIVQIEETMTREQLDAIAEMALTGEDVIAVSEQLGIEMAGGPAGDMTEEQREAMRVQMSEGGAPARGVPGQGPPGGVPGVGGTTGQTLSEKELAEMRAKRESGGSGMAPLIEALVERLAEKA